MAKRKQILDIGAGEHPYQRATVAIDQYPPTDVPKSVRVIKTKTGKRDPVDLPLKASSNLKTYIVGRAEKVLESLPNNEFDGVYSNSAMGVAPALSSEEFFDDVNRVMKPGAQLEIKANPGVGRTEKQQIAVSQEHIENLTEKLEDSGFGDVSVTGSLKRGFTTFHAKKKKNVHSKGKRNEPPSLRSIR